MTDSGNSAITVLIPKDHDSAHTFNKNAKKFWETVKSDSFPKLLHFVFYDYQIFKRVYTQISTVIIY